MNEDLSLEEGKIITIEDDEGNQHALEVVIEDLIYGGDMYSLLLPADMDEDDPDYGFIILRSVQEDDGFYYEDVEDEKTLNELYDRFMAILYSDEEADD